MKPRERNKLHKRGTEICNEQRAILVADAVRGVPLRQIEANHGPSKSTISDIVRKARKRKQAEIESLGLIASKQNKENWAAFNLVEPQYLKPQNSTRGRDRALSQDQITRMINHATASKAQRYKP